MPLLTLVMDISLSREGASGVGAGVLGGLSGGFRGVTTNLSLLSSPRLPEEPDVPVRDKALRAA